MNREKPYFLRRSIAYLIDFIIVMLLAGIIFDIFFKNDNYKQESQKLIELTAQYSQGQVTKEEYLKEYDDISYYLAKDSVEINIITCGMSLVYYVILCFYCGGITLGKRIMKLEIVSANGKNLNLGNFLLRSLIVNSVLSNLASIILVSVLKKESYIAIYPNVSNVLTVLLLVTLIFIMYREDGRGLHDLIANTKVISTKKKKEEKEEIQEAKVVEEKSVKKEKKTKKENGGKK